MDFENRLILPEIWDFLEHKDSNIFTYTIANNLLLPNAFESMISILKKFYCKISPEELFEPKYFSEDTNCVNVQYKNVYFTSSLYLDFPRYDVENRNNDLPLIFVIEYCYGDLNHFREICDNIIFSRILNKIFPKKIDKENEYVIRSDRFDTLLLDNRITSFS